MKTAATEMLGIELPIFAFSHCRDVVAAVSRAGGFGCLGAGYYTKSQLEDELRWIDDHVDGKPYGVDLLMPNKHAGLGKVNVDIDSLPSEQVNFLRKLLDDASVSPLPRSDGKAMVEQEIAKVIMDMLTEFSDALDRLNTMAAS